MLENIAASFLTEIFMFFSFISEHRQAIVERIWKHNGTDQSRICYTGDFFGALQISINIIFQFFGFPPEELSDELNSSTQGLLNNALEAMKVQVKLG